jgi:PAS domain S-box-containing protein
MHPARPAAASGDHSICAFVHSVAATMSIRAKTLLIVGVIMGLALIAEIVITRAVVLNGFSRLERREAERSLDALRSGLGLDTRALAATTEDWAVWDDTYRFAGGELPEFPEVNLDADVFRYLRIRYFVLFDRSGRAVFDREYNPETESISRIRPDLLDALISIVSKMPAEGEDSGVEGITVSPESSWMVASHTILTSAREGPARGHLLMARDLDQQLLDLISQGLEGSAGIHRLDDPALPPEARRMAQAGSGESGTAYHEGEAEATAYAALPDLSGQPALVLRISRPRAIFAHGVKVTAIFLVVMLVTAGVMAAALLLLLDRVVLNRLAGLSRQVKDIGSSGNPQARLHAQGQDEIGRLAEGLNSMLAALEATRRELESRQGELTALIDGLPAYVFMKDRNLRYVTANQRYCQALGRPLAELIGRTDHELVDPATAARDAEDEQRVLLTGTTLTREQDTFRDGGREFPALTRLVPLPDPSGAANQLIGLKFDITERTLLEQQLRMAQKMEAVGQMAAGMAHDFNNLLQIIGGFTRFAHDWLPSGHPLRPDLDRVLQACGRGAALTTQLLTFGRQRELDRVDVNLNQMLGHTVELLRRTIEESVRIEFRPAPEPLGVRADPGLLEQVIVNLCLNARDAMPNGGVLVIATARLPAGQADAPVLTRGGDQVLITVQDTGVGIPPEHQIRIFDPFFTTKPPGKGSGLGLSVAFEIIRRHDGLIRVESVVGQGTRFSILLPALPPEFEVASWPEPAAAPAGQETVLVAEDDGAVREWIERVLRLVGYRVLSAKDGEQTLRVFMDHAQSIRLVCMDAVLPGISGLRLCQRLREIRPDVRILVSTGHSAEAARVNPDDLPGVAMMRKPLDPNQLIREIQRMLAASLH